MTIKVTASNTQSTSPLRFTLGDRSGAHVILTVAIEGKPPITHAFAFDEGELSVAVDMTPGSYACSFVVQAFQHGALNSMYDTALSIGGAQVASAKGHIAAGQTFDVGFRDFVLTVV